MKVKTNFKKMYLVDSLPINNKNDVAVNDNTFLNKFIETNDTEKPTPIANNNGVEIINDNKSKKIINESVDEKHIEINDDSKENDKINQNVDENDIRNQVIDKNDNKESLLCETTTKDFNFKKCLDDCFQKSLINNKNENNDNINNYNDNNNNSNEDNDSFMEADHSNDNDNDNGGDDEKELLLRLQKIRKNKNNYNDNNNNSNEDNDSFMETDHTNDNDNDSGGDDEKELLLRLQKIRKNKKNLKRIKKKSLFKPHTNFILKKYKQKKYIPKQNLKTYFNKRIKNNSSRKGNINLKRKFIYSDDSDDSLIEKKRMKYSHIKSIPLIKNESNESNNIAEVDYSDISDRDMDSPIDSSVEDDDIDIEYKDDEKPYSLRKNRKKNQRYIDYIQNDLDCQNCGNEFKNQKALDAHVKTCKIFSFSCTICGKNYKTKWGLQSHLQNMHSKKKNGKNIT